MRPPFRAVAVAFAVLLSLAAASSAWAGSYTVRQCDYAAGNGYHDFQWQWAGTPSIAAHGGSGCAEFGLAARNGSGGKELYYPSGGYGGWFAYAPLGTVITRFSGAFGTLQGCCVNGVAHYAEASGPGGRAYLFQGHLGDNSWYAPSGLRGPVGRGWSASTSGFEANRVGFHLRCGPGFSCYQNPTGDFRVRGRSFDFTLRDDSPPWVAPAGGSLLGGGWLRGVRTLTASGGDVGAGLTGLTATFDSGTALSSPSSCTTVAGRYARLQPCPTGRSASWTVDTAKLPDGARTVAVRATDVGGAVGSRSYGVRVDNTPPPAPVAAAVVGGSAWRRANGFVVGWTSPGGQAAPIVRARFEACPVGGGLCVTGDRAAETPVATDTIVLSRAGEWNVRVWLEDAAGNADRSLASPALRVRFDPDPPVLRFARGDAASPTQVAVDAHDLSGVAGGAIEIRRQDGGDWEPLATTRHGSRLVADIDDTHRRGDYVLRAHAVDAAGNRATEHGGVRTLPVRSATRLDALVVKRTRAAKLGCRPVRSRFCRRAVVVRRAIVRARHGALVAIRGRLVGVAGQPLGGREIAVTMVSRNGTVRRPAPRTDAAGRLALVLRARRSAAIELAFEGDRVALPSSRRLAIHVPAPVTMRADRRLARGGQRVRFRGRVRGGHLPRRGKLVEVQAHFRGRWRTISAVRADARGRWRFGYAFNASPVLASYRLRARVPAEAGYPFAAGASKPVRVTVLGRCATTGPSSTTTSARRTHGSPPSGSTTCCRSSRSGSRSCSAASGPTPAAGRGR
jgi:hypothetical protein